MVSPRVSYAGHRNSYTESNEVYFWTITINSWNHLLHNDDNKLIVVSSLGIRNYLHCITTVRRVFVFEHFYCLPFFKPLIGNGLANGIAIDL